MSSIENPEIVDGITRYIDDIKTAHGDYHASGLDNLHKIESNHFWFVCRRKSIVNLFNKFINAKQKIIEVGAGTGSVSRALLASGYKVAVGELHLSGLYYAKSYGINELYQFDIYNPPFINEFDVVGMFDVLEHLENEALVLHNIAKILTPKGKVILTVPAHGWLWNRDDKIAGHKCRYTKKQLISTVKEAGFKVLEVRYFFIFILPLLWLRAIVNRDDGSVVKEEEYDIDLTISPIINKCLLALCAIEEKITKYIPNIAGGSLILIAEKK
jgi:2-polyprenyl-3-methyl-5-hydroxy-6-metoxy-1,4-benzoquinol methylase